MNLSNQTPSVDRKEFGVILIVGGILMVILSCATNIYMIGVESKDWITALAITASALTTMAILHVAIGVYLVYSYKEKHHGH